MTQVVLFFAILAFNAFKGLIVTPSVDQLFRLITFGGDIAMIFLVLISFRRARGFYGLKYLLAFLALSAFTLIYNLDRNDPVSHLNGMREPLFFFLALVIMYGFSRSEWSQRFHNYFNGFLLLFAVAQVPVSVLQFLRYGAGDDVGGTFGWGGSGTVTLLLFMIAFYVIVRWGSRGNHDYFSLVTVLLSLLLLIPCAINETKISFILLAVFIALLTLSKHIARAIPLLLLGIVVFELLVLLYSQTVESATDLLDQKFLETYLFHDTRTAVDIPRFQKMSMSIAFMAKDPPTLLVGIGYGVFAGGKMLGPSALSRTLSYLVGTRMYINTIWLQGGILALVLYGLCMFRFMKSGRVISSNMRRFRIFIFFMMAVMWFYSEAMLNRVFAVIAAYLILWIDDGGIDTVPSAATAAEDLENEIPIGSYETSPDR